MLITFQSSFPEKRCTVRKRDNGLHWYNDSLRGMRDSYLLLRELHDRYGTAELLRLRNSERGRYRDAIDLAKRAATNKYIDSSGNKARAMWQLINGNKKLQTNIPDNVDVNAMNHYFVNVAEDTVAQLPHGTPATAYASLTSSLFSFHLVSSSLIRSIVCSMKNSNTRDTFGLSTKFIKRNVSLFVEPLSKLVNLTLETSKFPDSLKIAKVLPIYKKGEINDYANYRPISILPSFSKIFERVIYDQIAIYLESNNALYLDQYGFRKGRNTSDAVVKFVNICTECYERGEYCVSFFIDLSRAFDCASHETLVKKLQLVFNFDHKSQVLISSYLSGRIQYVSCGRDTSSSLIIKRGVPQGSILGPLLFLMYFNDFPQCLEEGIKCLLYAHDATIMVSGTNYDEVQERCCTVMDNIRSWCIANELCLNEEKTVKMLFSLKRSNFQNPDPSRFLGVYMAAPFMKFDDHARHVGTMICRNMYLLRSLKSTMSQDIAKTAYHALIQSHINYSILAWGNTPASAYLFKLQRRAVRILGGLDYRDDCRHVFISLGILTLPSAYILQSIIYACSNRDNLRTGRDNHSYDTRNKNNIYPQYCRLTVTQRGPAHMSQVLYNKLPLCTRSLPLKKLKSILRLYLIERAFYSVNEFLDHNFLAMCLTDAVCPLGADRRYAGASQ